MNSRAAIRGNDSTLLVTRTTDPVAVNAVFNHPAVFPTLSLGFEGPLDMSPLLVQFFKRA